MFVLHLTVQRFMLYNLQSLRNMKKDGQNEHSYLCVFTDYFILHMFFLWKTSSLPRFTFCAFYDFFLGWKNGPREDACMKLDVLLG